MRKLLLLFIALLTGVSGAWAQVTSITDGYQYTIRLNNAQTYYVGYHYKTTTSAAPFKLIDSGATDDGYNLYYMQCPFTGKYLHSTRIEKNGSDISLEWVDDQASATTYTFRPTSAGSTEFRIFPNTSDYGLTAWNNNNPNYNIIPWDNNSNLGVWNLIDANGVNEINEFELQVTDLNGVFSRTGSGTSVWKDKWDARAALMSLQLTTSVPGSASRYDMSYSSPDLQMASSSDKTCYYTMTAPFGCVISGYRISGTTNGKLTLTKGNGTSIVYENGAILTDVGESGILRKSTKFTLQGENKVITGSLYIKVKRLKTISSVSEINRNKCYAIDTKDRGNWATRPDYSYLTRNIATGLNIASDFGDTKQQFAFVYHDDTDDGVDNGSYYIYTISTKKFISANGTSDNDLVVFADKASQSISFVETGDSDYPVCIEMSNTADLNVRNDSWEAGVTVYGTSGSDKTDDGNKVRIYEVGDFDPSEAEDTWNTADITYTLYYNGTQIGDPVTVEDVTGGTAAVIPSSMDNGFMTYTYTPERVSTESPTVRIDATWNGPFDIYDTYSTTNHFYTISHNYSERANNYIWTYDGSSAIIPQITATDAYAINNNCLFCFVGDPYNGLTIYNRAAGSSKTVYSGGQNVAVVLSSTNTTSFIPTLATSSSVPSNPSYFALKAKDTSYWLNWNKYTLAGYTQADNGGTCWVLPEGRYYLNFLNGLILDAPVGAVGTSEYIVNEETKTSLVNYKNSLTENLFYLDDLTVSEKGQAKTVFGGVGRSNTIALSDGYYRIVNFKNDQGTSMVFNPSIASTFDAVNNAKANRIIWTSTDKSIVGNIFYLSGSGTSFSIKNCNKDEYLSSYDGTTQAASANTTFEDLGNAQYKLTNNGGVLHANLWNSNPKTNGNIINHTPNPVLDSPSAWYIVKATDFTINLNAVGDGNFYATGYWPFDVTIYGANAYTLAVSADKKRAIPTEVTDNKVPAGTPVLLKGASATATAIINTGDAFNGGTPLSCALTGTYKNLTVTAETDYFLGRYRETVDDDYVVGFYKWDGTTLLANRAYIKADDVSLVKGLVINWGDETGVESVQGSGLKVNDVIYNLAGQRLSKVQSGVNIVNGKKVLVK